MRQDNHLASIVPPSPPLRCFEGVCCRGGGHGGWPQHGEEGEAGAPVPCVCVRTRVTAASCASCVQGDQPGPAGQPRPGVGLLQLPVNQHPHLAHQVTVNLCTSNIFYLPSNTFGSPSTWRRVDSSRNLCLPLALILSPTMGTMRGESDTGNNNLLTFQSHIFSFRLTILGLSVIVLEYLGRGPHLAPPAATVRLQTHNPERFTRFYHSSKL